MSLQQGKVCVTADLVCVVVAVVWIRQMVNTPVCVTKDSSPTHNAHPAKVNTHTPTLVHRLWVHNTHVLLRLCVTVCDGRCE